MNRMFARLSAVWCLWCLGAVSEGLWDGGAFINWNNPPSRPQPLLTHRTYFSEVMRTTVGYNLYFPPGYRENGSTNRYPVVYWCHGMTCNESTDQFPAAIVDQAIRSGRVPPLIFVYVSGGSHSFYCDSPDMRWAAETTIVSELIPQIDSTCRTLASREFRAIQGMSMGGFGAVRLALKHPDLFGSATAFAGAFVEAERMTDRRMRGTFSNMFGGDTNRFNEAHPFTLAKAQADAVRGSLGIKLVVGEDDFLIEPNRAMKALLAGARLAFDYDEAPGVGHDLDRLARWTGSDALEFAAKHFGTARAVELDGPWVNPPTAMETPPGVEHHVFWSPSLRRPVGYNIYLPPQYYGQGPGRGLSSKAGRFPVVYHLHGFAETESSQISHARLLHQAVASGKLPPVIYVQAYGGRTGWFSDRSDNSVLAETVFVNELIPHIDSRWRTLADQGRRALQGWGMGGFGALKIAAKHPALFSSVLVLAGEFPDMESMRKDMKPQWQGIWGSDAAQWERDSPWALIPAKKAAFSQFALRLMVGGGDVHLEANRSLHRLLDQSGIPHEYEELPRVGHDAKQFGEAAGWGFWSFAVKHFNKL